MQFKPPYGWLLPLGLAVMVRNAVVCGGTEPGAAAPALQFRSAPTVTSPSQRFLVTGLDAAGNAALALAAEEAAERLASFLGMPIPTFRNQPIAIIARRDPERTQSEVRPVQGWTERHLTQKLYLVNPETGDQEDVLEALVWLLLNRFAIARQDPADRRRRPAEMPEWLAVGVAQNLYASFRARNIGLVLSRWRDGDGLALSQILALEYLPPGRWSEKAQCGVAVDWLSSVAREHDLWEVLFDRVAKGGKIEPEWMADRLLGSGSARLLEKHRELWLARQLGIKRIGGTLGSDPLPALDALLTLHPREAGWSGSEPMPETLSLEQLIERRQEPWAPVLARWLTMKLQVLGLGEDVEFQRVLKAYSDFLEQLAAPPPRGLLIFFHHPRRIERRLLGLLQQAETARAEYAKLAAKRTQYVTEAELHLTPSAPPAAWEAERCWLPRSELQRYVDDRERSNADLMPPADGSCGVPPNGRTLDSEP